MNQTPNDIRVINHYHVLADAKDIYVDFQIWEDDGTDDNYRDNEPLMIGSIKWDGCSNWDFPCKNTYPLHFCAIDLAQDFGNLFAELYRWAAELLPEYKNDIIWKER